jgi:polyferredoxin
MALASEHASKNWIKIPIKFLLWLIFLPLVFIMSQKNIVTETRRKWLLFISVVIFGVITGMDPSPMGTIHDAIHLYATTHAIFPPRMIAMLVFLLIVFFVNKYICAWGCQFGTLQDLLFRINQTSYLNAVFGKQIKVPFVVTNTFRVTFFTLFTLVAFLWAYDSIEAINPFKVYNPLHMGIPAAIFAGVVLVTSLIIYRPWCHCFCPFGLIGWLVECFSRIKINVNYDTCVACQDCASACPSTVMAAILKQDKKVIPDCFACYACRDSCPTRSIQFSSRRRTIPPAGHFHNDNQ